MRTIKASEVTNGTEEAFFANADKGTYTTTAVTCLDAAGQRQEHGHMTLNGAIVIENAYTSTVLYRLPTGEIVVLDFD